MDSLPVKVAYCLFCLCSASFFRWEEGALFFLSLYVYSHGNAYL